MTSRLAAGDARFLAEKGGGRRTVVNLEADLRGCNVSR